jgi:hypothetical protein
MSKFRFNTRKEYVHNLSLRLFHTHGYKEINLKPRWHLAIDEQADFSGKTVKECVEKINDYLYTKFKVGAMFK